MEQPVTGRVTDDLPESSAETAADAISDDATILVSGFGSVGYPKRVPLALAEDTRDLSLTVISSGGVGDEIDTALVEADAVARRYPGQSRPAMREAINDGEIAYQDRHYSSFGDEVKFGRWFDESVAIVEAIAVGEDWLVPSTAIGHTPAFVNRADHLVVEVNEAQPLALQHLHDVYHLAPPPERGPIPLSDPNERVGSPFIRFDPEKMEAVVRTDRPDTTYSYRDLTCDDEAIVENFLLFVREEMSANPMFADALAFEMGVGNVGNALLEALSEMDVGARDIAFFGEVFQDGILELVETDAFVGGSAASLALSSEGLSELLDDAERYADSLVLRPMSITNHPTLIDRFGVIGVNSAIEVDLYGNVNSTHIDGRHVVNGIGGSGDFNRNGALAVVVLASTANDGEISRVVPKTAHVDHTEHDIDVVVTDQGVADLRGCVPTERAERIISNCAHPDHRNRLSEYLERAKSKGGHEPHDLDTAFDHYID